MKYVVDGDKQVIAYIIQKQSPALMVWQIFSLSSAKAS